MFVELKAAPLAAALLVVSLFSIACGSNTTTRPSQVPTREALVQTNAPSLTFTATLLPTLTSTLVDTVTPPSTATKTLQPTATEHPKPTFTSAVAPTLVRMVPPTKTTPLQAKTATLPPAPRVLAPRLAFQATDLIAVPEGLLRMGTPQGEQGEPDEKPQHDVTVYSFSIERYEVTNPQYQGCVAARACPTPTLSGSFTRPSYFGNPDFDNFPVVNVTWFDADAYCSWIGRRLPTEAEWERAARGVDNWRYTFTNVLGMPFEWNAIYHGSPISFCEASCPLENYWGSVNDGFADTAPVGWFSVDSSKGFGVQDMAGNVSEWTSAWYDPSAYTDGNDAYGSASPTGFKVYRGGSWADTPTRNAKRNSLPPNFSSDRLGFRCAR